MAKAKRTAKAKKTTPKAKRPIAKAKAAKGRSVSRGWPKIKDPVTGRMQSLYCAQYRHAGAIWGLDFWADDAKDAAAKLRSIRSGLTMVGVTQGAAK